jgi:hypothetical protein
MRRLNTRHSFRKFQDALDYLLAVINCDDLGPDENPLHRPREDTTTSGPASDMSEPKQGFLANARISYFS